MVMRFGMARTWRSLILPLLAVTAAAVTVAVGTSSASADIRPAIVGGSAAAQGTWPYAAVVLLNAPDETGQCTGTVVAPNLVLTAGHCAVDPNTGTSWAASDYTVLTGSVNPAVTPAQSSGVTRVVPDPAYVDEGSISDWDAALLQLAVPTTAAPVALATPSVDAGLYVGGTVAEMAGWGLTVGGDDSSLPENLQYASTTVQNAGYCSSSAQSLGADLDTADQMCTIAPAENTSFCQGDSGGPLVATGPSGTAVQIGIVSFTTSSCVTNRPDFFTSIDGISSWLAPEIVALSPPAVTTAPAADVTSSSAVLDGTVTPNAGPTSYYFQWGTTSGYGSTTSSQTTSTAVSASAEVSGLPAATTIHYRLVASNQNGTTYGADETLTTAISTLTATSKPAASAPSTTPLPGVYKGKTKQHRPIVITLGITRKKAYVHGLSFGFAVRCTRHRGSLHYSVKAPTKAWPRGLSAGRDFRYTFDDPEHWRYVIRAVFSSTGSVSGTLSVAGNDSSYGRCRSGAVRWSAKA